MRHGSSLRGAFGLVVGMAGLVYPMQATDQPHTHIYIYIHRQSLVAIAATAPAGSLFRSVTCPPPSPTSISACPGRHAAQLAALEARVGALEKKEQKGRKDASAPAFSIRSFQPGDAEAVRSLVAAGRAGAAQGRCVGNEIQLHRHTAFCKTHRPLRFFYMHANNRPAVLQFLRKALEGDLAEMGSRYGDGERFWVMVARDSGAVVGCVGLRIAAAAEERKGEGEIVRLTVAERLQRRGLGRQLLRRAEAYAHSPECSGGLRQLRATTLDERALPGACAFYISEGYVLERRQPFGKGEGELCHLSKRLV